MPFPFLVSNLKSRLSAGVLTHGSNPTDSPLLQDLRVLVNRADNQSVRLQQHTHLQEAAREP